MNQLGNMTKVQTDLYVFRYNARDQDFNVLSLSEQSIVVPACILDEKKSIKDQLDSLLASYIDSKPSINYRLFNNIIIDNTFHCIYFTTIPENSRLNKQTFLLSVKKHGIYSPNIQKIMQLIC